MVDFFINILLPIIIGLIVISIVFKLVSMLLELIKLDYVPNRILVFLVAYYFVGPYILSMVEGSLFSNMHPFAIFFYEPVQYIIGLFS